VSLTAHSTDNTSSAAMTGVHVALVDVVELKPTATTISDAQTFIADGADVHAGNVSLATC
jgi:hypothetical protein